METSLYKDRSTHLLSIYQQAVEAADPARCVERHLSFEHQELQLKGHTLPLSENARVILLAIGKASIRMTQAAVLRLGSRVTRGLVVTPGADNPDLPNGFEVIQGGHPLPTQGSLAAGAAAQELLHDLQSKDIVLALISGGGSALLEMPRPGISLQDLQQINQSLLRSGAPIEKVNVVRKAMSLSKAGGLARLAAPAQVVGLILSDVIGNPLEAIASGPTVLEQLDLSTAIQILQKYDLWDSLPGGVRQAFNQSSSTLTPAPQPINILIGSNHMLVEAAVKRAVELGFEPISVGSSLTGEARQVGEAVAQEMIAMQPGGCLIQGGETTVTIRGDGRGGRNQELALAAAIGLNGAHNLALLSAASDGVDGPTDAAGAWVDGHTIAKAEAAGLDAAAFLEQNDSYTFFSRLDALIKPGLTGTNVNDLVVGLKYTSGG
jgi:hydroxypyruvate reductase